MYSAAKRSMVVLTKNNGLIPKAQLEESIMTWAMEIIRSRSSGLPLPAATLLINS